MEKSNQASIDTSPYWRLVGCTLHGTTWKCTHAKNYINYTVMLLFESPSGHHIAIPESLYQAFSNRETGHLSRFFCAWVSTSGSLYPCLYREKNTEPWDTRMKRADVKHRPLANTTLADTGLYLGTCAAPGAGWHVVRNRSSGRCCSIDISSKRQRAREITASRVQD